MSLADMLRGDGYRTTAPSRTPYEPGYVRPPPPDRGLEWRGSVMWPFGSTRRNGYLLEVRVKELDDRLAWTEAELTRLLGRRDPPPSKND